VQAGIHLNGCCGLATLNLKVGLFIKE